MTSLICHGWKVLLQAFVIFFKLQNIFLPLQKGRKVLWPNGRSESEPVGKTVSKWSGEKSPTVLNWNQFWPGTCVLSEKYFLLTFLIGLSHKAYCPFLLGNIDIFFSDARDSKMPISVLRNKFSYSDEINRLNERLREKGVDIETERKLEQESIKRKIAKSLSLCFNSVLYLHVQHYVK